MVFNDLIFKFGYQVYSTTSLGKYVWKNEAKSISRKSPHSQTKVKVYGGKIRIVAVAIGEDNYSFVVSNLVTDDHVIIDPGLAEPIMNVLDELEIVQVRGVLITHYHWDHCAGLKKIVSRFPRCVVWGSSKKPTSCQVDKKLVGDMCFSIGAGLRFQAIFTPGHTKGHICYLLLSSLTDKKLVNHLFTGDHVFLYGCGMNFEASPKEMVASIDKLLRVVSDETTLMWPGHEYTVNSLAFVATCFPDCANFLEKYHIARLLRKNHLATLPISLKEQTEFNIFLFQPPLFDVIKRSLTRCSNSRRFTEKVDYLDFFREKRLEFMRDASLSTRIAVLDSKVADKKTRREFVSSEDGLDLTNCSLEDFGDATPEVSDASLSFEPATRSTYVNSAANKPASTSANKPATTSGVTIRICSDMSTHQPQMKAAKRETPTEGSVFRIGDRPIDLEETIAMKPVVRAPVERQTSFEKEAQHLIAQVMERSLDEIQAGNQSSDDTAIIVKEPPQAVSHEGSPLWNVPRIEVSVYEEALPDSSTPFIEPIEPTGLSAIIEEEG